LLIAEDPDELPRLIQGLPGIVEVLGPYDINERLAAAIERLLKLANGTNRGRRPVG
jgi:hypothetical protein